MAATQASEASEKNELEASSQNNELQEEVNENNLHGGKFGVETAVNDVEDLAGIDFQSMTMEDLLMYHFPDSQTTFMFYNRYAGQHEFAARKCRVVYDCFGEKIQQIFVCHRGVKQDNIKKENRGTKKGGSKPIIRCDCPALTQVHIDVETGRWYIKRFYDEHNHAVVDDNFQGMLPAHRKLSDYDKYQMTSMRDVGIKTSDIYRYAASQAGGFDKVGLSKRDVQ